MVLVINDIFDQKFMQDLVQGRTDIMLLGGKIEYCRGCFGCWVKKPGECILNDDYKNLGKLLSQTRDIIVISKCTYGSLSPFVKNVVDRTISFVLPSFRYKNKKMFHKPRYYTKPKTTYIIYGSDITQEEEMTARAIAKENCENSNELEGSFYICKQEDVLSIYKACIANIS